MDIVLNYETGERVGRERVGRERGERKRVERGESGRLGRGDLKIVCELRGEIE